MRATILNICILTASTLFCLGGSILSGQAMISYGHGVAKAAGAGAAAGAGVGGVLSGLGNPLSKAAGRPSNTSVGGARATRQATVPQRRQHVAWDAGRQSFGSPAPVGLIGGVQATGVAADNWQPPLLEPSENLAVLSVQWGGASPTDGDIPAAATADSSTVPSPVDGEAVVLEESEPEDSSEQVTVLRSARPTPSSAIRKPTSGSATTAPQIPAGVTVGSSVDEVIRKLGKPHLSFRGVAGAGYNDQYIFELADGSDLVVYVLDGIVSHVAVS